MTKEMAYRELSEHRNKKVYVTIPSVSRSGMSRRMYFYVVKDDELINITEYIATLLGYFFNWDKGMFVKGCGMDMIFHVITSVNYKIAYIETGELTKDYSGYFFDANRYSIIR